MQLPLALGEGSEPEPDIAIVASTSYKAQHPTSAIVVMEVAESSGRTDRREKSSLYAEHRIAEYWFVDTIGERIEVHADRRTEPTAA